MDTTPDFSAPENLARLPESLATTPLVVPVIEERAIVTREVIEKGRLQLTKRVSEKEEQIQVLLQQEEIDVERVPVNQYVADDVPLPTTRQEGNITIIPVLREVVVTRVLVVEEIRLTKHIVEAPETHRVQLRQEEVQIVHRPAGPESAAGDLSHPS